MVLVVWVGLSAIIISLVVSQFDQSAKIAVGKEIQEHALFAEDGFLLGTILCLFQYLQKNK